MKERMDFLKELKKKYPNEIIVVHRTEHRPSDGILVNSKKIVMDLPEFVMTLYKKGEINWAVLKPSQVGFFDFMTAFKKFDFADCKVEKL